MRILLLSDFYPPSPGGTQQHVRNLACALARRGHVVHVGSTTDEHSVPQDDGVTYHQLHGWASVILKPFYKDPDAFRFVPPTPDPGLAKDLRELVGSTAPDVVHAHGWITYPYLASAARGALPPSVATLHDYGMACSRRDLRYFGGEICAGPSRQRCYPCARQHYGAVKGGGLTLSVRAGSRLLDRLDACLAVSRAVEENAHSVAELRHNTAVVPNFIADSLIESEPQRMRDDDGEFDSRSAGTRRSVMFAGVLASHKGVDTLTEAYPAFRDLATLTLVGPRVFDSPTTWPADVVVRDNLPHDDLMKAITEVDVVVVPSVWADPCPTIALEVLAQGGILVASDVGGLTDIVVAGESGLLFEAGNPQALAAAVREALLMSPQRRQEMRVAAVRRAREHFSEMAVVPQIEAVYAGIERSSHD